MVAPRRFKLFLAILVGLTMLSSIIYIYSQLDGFFGRQELEKRWRRRSMKSIDPDYGERLGTGPGEQGAGVILSGTDLKLGERQMTTWFMNVVASDRISLDRSIPDTRPPSCSSLSYRSTELPSASVVIVFTDEAWSPLLRTVHSVVNRSPVFLLHEILLVDDSSTRTELNRPLRRYLRRFGNLVRMVRSDQRLGLIRAKLFGAERVSGKVIVFLDSHCEANIGWLEPLLDRINRDRSVVVCPIIDHISSIDFSYHGDSNAQLVGGFWWSLHFKWDDIPEKKKKRRLSHTDPILSPTMAGGLLAIDREYFFEIGGYDSEMDIWGGENLELSFRVWMCGGSLEFIPCSHVGHVFRAGHPYNMTGRGGNKDVHGTNSKRLAEIWMDDYKRLYYAHRPDLKDKDVGDLTERKELRKRLKCHSFKWYLDNVIPDKFIPDENVLAFGMVRNPSSNLCLDTLQKDEKTSFNLGVFGCQFGGSSSQVFSLSKRTELRREELCSQANMHSSVVLMARCSLGSATHSAHQWQHTKDMQIIHNGMCLDVHGLSNGNAIRLAECNDEKNSQKWTFETYLV